MTTSETKPTAPVPAEPGGPRRGRAGLVVIGVVAAVAAGGFGIVTAYAGQTPGIVGETVSYQIADASVRIDYRVAKGKDDEVSCTVDAFDEGFNVLGEKKVSVPAGKNGVKGTETLPTPRRATGARIRDCRTVTPGG